jgi:hypothetical protein
MESALNRVIVTFWQISTVFCLKRKKMPIQLILIRAAQGTNRH